MKKFIISMAAILFLMGAGQALAQSAQDQSAAPDQPTVEEQQQQQASGPEDPGGVDPAQDQGPDRAPNQAQDQSNGGQADQGQADQAQPGVARVSMIHGDVSTQRGDNGDWVAVTLNTPISNGDRVSTGNGSRAELQLDATNILRLSDNASAKVASLYRNQIQLQVGQGLVTYNVLNGSEASSEIDTPNVAVHPAGAGEYRIQVNSSSETVITIRRGAADVTTPQGSTRVIEGQSITVQGTDNPQYQVHNAPARD
ncbi:MAG: FecR domain-containing protein, partial [Candidatus Acidiferrales bacterium]